MQITYTREEGTMKTMKRLLVFTLIAVMVFTMAACGSSGGTPSGEGKASSGDTISPDEAATDLTPTPGGTINIQWDDTSEPFGLPWFNGSGSGGAKTPAIEGLGFQSIDGTYEPWLAEKWEIQMDQNRIVYTLRQGIKFHDGSDFNADVVGWNLQQWIDHHAINPNITGYEVLSDYEIAVLFEHFSQTIVSAMCAQVRVVSQKNFEDNGEEYALQHICGTGPFKLVSYTPGGEAVFEKNADYWRENEPYLDGITFVNLPDDMSRTLAVQTDGATGLDILYSSNAEQVKTLLDSTDVEVINNPNGAVTIFPSSANPDSPFAKLEVRQALNYAIDRDALMGAFGFGLLTPAYQFISEKYNGHFDDPAAELPKSDPAKAKELLATAGYPDGFKTTLIGEYALVSQDFVTALASQLAAVGIECEMEFPTQGASNDYRMTGGYEGIFVGRLTDFTDIFLTFMLMGMDPTNPDAFYPGTWRPDSDEAKDLFMKIAGDDTGSAEYPQDLAKLMLANVVNVPLYFTSEFFVIKPDVHGGGFGTYAGGQDWEPGLVWKQQ
jgi:ABC-type transport system substrate-binding protein